jgi:hypothetical protein
MLFLGLGAWAVLAAAAAVIFGRALHNADRMDRPREPLVPQLDIPLKRAGAVRGDPNAGDAILNLARAGDEIAARHWLTVCARHGIAQPTLDELWRQWQTEHPHPEDRL